MLQTGQTKSSTKQGFRTRGNTIYTYEQAKGGPSYFYFKREVLADGIHTKPHTITLRPWPVRNIEMVEDDHPWRLDKLQEFDIDGKKHGSLAEVCLVAYRRPNMLEIMHTAISQIP